MQMLNKLNIPYVTCVLLRFIVLRCRLSDICLELKQLLTMNTLKEKIEAVNRMTNNTMVKIKKGTKECIKHYTQN